MTIARTPSPSGNACPPPDRRRGGPGVTDPTATDWMVATAGLLPGILSADDYVTRTAAAARRAGFASGDTLPMVATCRDELMVGFTELVDRVWGPHYAIGSLGGLVLAGVSGIGAAVGHAPDGDGALSCCTACRTSGSTSMAPSGWYAAPVSGTVHRHAVR